MIIFVEIIIQQIMQVNGIPRTGYKSIFPEVKEPHLLTKQAQLALLLHNNQHLNLTSTTIKTMMALFQQHTV